MTKELLGYTNRPFEYAGISHAVYQSAKNGPGVLLMHELPGLTPECISLANRICQSGFTVFLPLLFGEPNETAMFANTLRVCVSHEFKCLAEREDSPITPWLRALSRDIYERMDGTEGIGVICLCLTGGFVLSLMADKHVLAPITSEPSLPLPAITEAAKRAFGVSDQDLTTSVERDIPLLGFRFSNDLICPSQRFDALKEKFGDNFERHDITSPSPEYNIRDHAHAVLTEDYSNAPGHPTHIAFERVISFLTERLKV